MLIEIVSNEFKTYVQELRQPKDDYTKRKIQKDRQKLLAMLEGLMEDREVIIFFNEGGVEKQVVGTRKKYIEKEYLPELPLPPKMIEMINNNPVEETHHIVFWQIPLREPTIIHLDDVTKFIVRAEGLTYDFFMKIKHERE